MPKIKLEEEYSLYLGCTRFLAAMLVVVAHFIQYGILSKSVSYYLPELGREAVMIFFVLSGYVIAYSCDLKKPSLREYIIARAARIYSVALPVLLFSFLAFYFISEATGKDYYQLTKAYIYIPFHSLFLGEIWNFTERPLGLVPYWSLSYEVWYYIFFASVYYFSGSTRLILAAIIFLILGHKLWLLLPIWWAGVALYKFDGYLELGESAARLGWVISLFGFTFFKWYGIDVMLREYGNEIWPFDSLSLGSADRYLSDYIVTMFVLLNFYCAKYAHFYALLNFKSSIRAVSAYTFTLYLVHALSISVWSSFHKHEATSLMEVLLLIVLITISTLGFAQITERRKYLFKQYFEYIYNYSFGKRNLDTPNPNSKVKGQ